MNTTNEIEDTVLHLLCGALGGHSITIVRKDIGRMIGFSVGKNRSIAIRDIVEATAQRPEQIGTRCLGCGSSWDSERLASERSTNPKLISCCPEREIVPVYAAPIDRMTIDQAWTELCETPDITSPEEYPDHALITMEQLEYFMAMAAPSPQPDVSSEPVAWQQLRDGKWAECSEFVAKGWSDKPSDDCRPLFTAPQPNSAKFDVMKAIAESYRTESEAAYSTADDLNTEVKRLRSVLERLCSGEAFLCATANIDPELKARMDFGLANLKGEHSEARPHPCTKGPLFGIDTNRKGKEPCGECHIQPGETCDICGASHGGHP